MFHVKRSILFLIVWVIGFYLSSNAQGYISLTDKEFIHTHDKQTDILRGLDSLEGYQSLSNEEREAAYWVNFVRMYPKAYHRDILLPFLEQFPEVKSNYTTSLAKELTAVAPAGFVSPLAKLNKIAYAHAKDLGSSGHRISHNSSSGSSFQKRMNDGGIFGCISENIYEGKLRPLQSVLFLLIDAGVPNLGHRKNILDNKMHSVGIAYYPIKGKQDMYYSVQNFYCGDPL